MEATLSSPLGRTILGTNILTIGSAPDNQLVVKDDSVGPHHAEIHPQEQGHSITDLGSPNGTFVNGQRVYPNIPQTLQSGDSIRTGNITHTYEIVSKAPIPPTVYAFSDQPVDPGRSTPAVMASGQNSNPYSTPAPPPPPISNPYNVYDPYGGSAPPAEKKRGHRGLWIALGAVGGILVLIIVFVVIASRGPSTTPTQTYQTYCENFKAHNAQALYGMYTASARQQLAINSVNDLVPLANATNDCTVSNIDDSAGTGIVALTLQNVGKLSFSDTLVDEDNTWKIGGQKPLPSPTRTLFNYCNALEKGDYHTAYNQLNTDQQKLQTEEKFTANFNGVKVTDCTLSNVDDTAGTAILTYTFDKTRIVPVDEVLVQEHGTWKIKSEQARSTPTLTLTNYCNALKQGDYHTAYNQLSSDAQQAQTEAEFTANFNGIKVTECTVSNVDDTAGTGTITYTLDNGKTGILDEFLVQENGTWKMKSEKAHQ